MKVLVTGGCGFVGRYFTKHFIDQGYEVDCVDNLVAGTGAIHPRDWPVFNIEHHPGLHFHAEDCRDFIKGRVPDEYAYVVHLAAIVGGRLVIENDPIAVATDLSIDSEIINWVSNHRERSPKLVYFSSSAAYPVDFQKKDGYHLLEETEIDFNSPFIGKPDLTYGWAKLTGEYLITLAVEKKGLRAVVYRPFSGFGEDQDLSYPFPAICKRAIEHDASQAFVVWGTGQQMRDFVHITDCVRCVVKTMDQSDRGDVFNISSGIYTSFIELAQMCLQEVKKTSRVVGMSTMPEGVFARGGATAKQREHGFTPEIPLADGIKAAIAFRRQRL